jgi:hypothetical protein
LKEPIKFFEADLRERSAKSDAGAIEQEREASMARFDGSGERSDGAGIGDIEYVFTDFDTTGACRFGVLRERLGFVI